MPFRNTYASTVTKWSPMDRVLDAFALLAWLQDEPGAPHIDGLLLQASANRGTLSMSSINVGEIYYRLAKSGKEALARRVISDIQVGEIPVHRVAATNMRVDAAAKLKAKHAISYADAFAAALAIELRIPLVTNDPELVRFSHEGLVEVEWVATDAEKCR